MRPAPDAATPAGFALACRRELLLLRRRRAPWALAAASLLLGWLPLLWPGLRGGELSLATAQEAGALAVALTGVVWPLLALLFGTDALAGELEDRTLLPLVAAGCSRTRLLAGKAAARSSVLTATALLGFGSAAVAGGGPVWRHALAAWLLGLVAAIGGVAAATVARTRARALVAALLLWFVFVFLFDAALLGALIALAPPAPGEVGTHGHGELTAPPPGAGGSAGVALLLDPVDLFRLTALPPAERALAGFSLPGTALAIAWACWLALTAAVLWHHARRLPLF